MKNFFKEHWIVVAIMTVAAFLRLWEINVHPGGLFPDEAANGLDINLMFDGQIQPFYERGNGREALFFYVIALVVSFFGRGVWQHHVVSAGFGIAEVFSAYLLTARLFGKRMAYLSAFLMAVSSYAVLISRTAFRANTIPLFTTLTLYFLVKFFQTQDSKTKLWSAFWAGISFGLGFYTYISYRMMIPLLVMFGVIVLVALRDRLGTLSEYLKAKWAFASGFLISFAWLGYYFFTHPGSFVGRAGQVSIFSEELNQGDIIGTFLKVFKLTMLSFFTEGDLNWRHNVSGYPFLMFLVSPFFGLGLIIFSWAIIKILKQALYKEADFKTGAKALIGTLFWFMMVPEVTTAEGIPHGLRLIGVIPAIYIMSAYGMIKVWDYVKPYLRLQFSRIAIPAFILVAIFCYNTYLYFGVAAQSPEYYYAFRSDLTTVSDYLNDRNQETTTYLSLDKFSVQSVDYLTTEKSQPFILVDPAHTFEVKLKPKDQVVFTMSTLYDSIKFLETHPNVKLVKEERNQFNQIIMLVYEQ
jgi:4-amino-4-deoxy-L-arabinose transferase-like glycosyltransferase